MVATPKVLVAYAALALAAISGVSAAPLVSNPEMDIAPVVPLMAPYHPARGFVLKHEPQVKVFDVVVNEAASLLLPPRRLRKLESGGNSDIERLESYFDAKMERNFNELMDNYRESEVKNAPWPSSYWPMYRDGLNYRWDGDEPSPAEKYARAFDKNVDDFKEAISKKSGVLSQDDNKSCSEDSDCDGDYCGKREGESSGYCIPHWSGICHAWAPAAIFEPEPRCSVVKNGVTFNVLDIKGLLTQVYNSADIGTVFTGARYDGPSDSDAIDNFGRFTDAARRDLGAGYFHIAFSNIMGKHGKSFVIDTSPDAAVWNQPIRSYNVKNTQTISPGIAGAVFFGASSYPFNDDATKIVYVETEIAWIIEREDSSPYVPDRIEDATHRELYTYVLELNDDDEIIGGEWVGKSKTDHPDFLWLTTERAAKSEETAFGLVNADVQELLEMSVACNSESSSENSNVNNNGEESFTFNTLN